MWLRTTLIKLFGRCAGMYSDMQQYYDTNMQHNYFGQKSFDYLTSLMGNDMIMTGRFGMSLYHYLLDYWSTEHILRPTIAGKNTIVS